jgi:hypothetical protein
MPVKPLRPESPLSPLKAREHPSPRDGRPSETPSARTAAASQRERVLRSLLLCPPARGGRET